MTSLLFQSSDILLSLVLEVKYFSVLLDRLQILMLRNSYISKEVQKGFLAGMSGCIEHTFALLIRDAKESHRQIAITWLDHFVKAGVQIARNRKQR